MEQNPKDLIKRLLVHDRTKRLGNMKAGADDIKKHRWAKLGHEKAFSRIYLSVPRWFKSVDWEEVYQRELKPPIVPKVSSDGDTRNFDNYPEEDWRKVEPVTERQLAMFSDFWCFPKNSQMLSNHVMWLLTIACTIPAVTWRWRRNRDYPAHQIKSFVKLADFFSFYSADWRLRNRCVQSSRILVLSSHTSACPILTLDIEEKQKWFTARGFAFLPAFFCWNFYTAVFWSLDRTSFSLPQDAPSNVRALPSA